MAIRNILNQEEDLLYKKSRPVTDFNERLWQLLDDMAETLHKADGVGLAAPQVGVLRRVFIMDFGDGVIEVINPEYIKKKGKQEDIEGCLSCPGEYGITRRPAYVKIKAQDRFGKPITVEGDGLKARCICHESDHLDGVIFKQHVVRMLDDDELMK
ncbi:MAG: peptide deformylase [Oscillospiraceae bacterium]|jgi:peptide deformylase|nr:peptide deformylase [Oscillospiraceae bacterium]